MWLKSTTTPHCFAYLRYIRILITSITSLNQNKIFWNFGFEQNRKHWQDRKLRLSWNGRRGYSTMNKLCEHDLISCPLCRVARRAALSDKIMEYPVLSPQLSNREFKSAIAILTLLPLLYKIIVGTILQSNLLSFQIHNFPLFDTINTRWSVISRIFPLRTLMINISVQL